MRSSKFKCIPIAVLLAFLGAASGCHTSRWHGPALARPIAGITEGNSPNLLAAESAYYAANRLESAGDEGCVDAYFEVAKSSWFEVRNTMGLVDATSVRASQLYHSSLAKLIWTGKRFDRLDPVHGLSLHGLHGSDHVAIQYQGFVWQPGDFNDFILVGDYSSDKLLTTYRSPGLGVPLLVIRKREFDEPMRRREQLFPATVVLRSEPDQSFTLDFCDPIRVAGIDIGDQTVAISRDLSAPFAYRAAKNGNSALQAFRLPSSTGDDDGLYAIEPYQPGKIPIIFVHGLLSDPTTWIAMANELRVRPDILEQYQFWAFEYPTGEPFVRSALTLREELAESIRIFDPNGQDPALSNMVVIGHSMGGLVAKLQITTSHHSLWNAIANRPFDQIAGADETLDLLGRLVFFEPQPAIKRVVMIATPHDGAETAQRLVGRITSLFVKQPEDRQASHQRLVAENPAVFSSEFRKRIPTSIDLLEPDSPSLQGIKRLPIASCVALHSVIGYNKNPLCKPTDGVVSVESARHPGVESELFVSAGHTKVQSHPATIEEVLRILRLHATTSRPRNL